MENYSFSDLITFTRTTNATLVDGIGNVTYAPNNLFTNSEAFENAAWVKGNSTVTANATVAPNGTTTADKSVENTATSTHQITQQTAFVSGTSYTWSFYVKAAERSAVRVLFPAAAFTSNLTANFDLATGAWITSSPAPSAGLTLASQDVGNGWYRISATATATASLNQTILLYLLNTPSGTGSYTGDGTSGLFIWGAQLEAVTYQTTAGTYNSTSPPNLLGFTQEFENAGWTKAGATISQNITVSPDDTLNADKLVEDSSTGQHRVQQAATTVSGTSYTYSVYLKAGERTVVTMRAIGTTTFAACTINLTAGTISSVTGVGTITNAGNGWYRVSVTGTADSTTSTCYVNLSNGGINYTGDGSSGAFVWGAQLSNSASVDPYVYNPGAAPTSTAYYGPRFDYNPTTLAPLGLLIEEQRVNLLLYSDQFDNAAWTNSFATLTANVTTSPDGTTNADRLTADGSLNPHDVRQTKTFTAAAHTLSVYAKKDTNDFLQLRFGSAAIAGGTGFANFDLNAGTVGTIGAGLSAASITPVGNGWYRCAITGTTAATSTVIGFYVVASATAPSAEGNTLTTSVFIYGAQLEVGAFPTSYIPTVASTVTRAADSVTMTGANFSSWYNASEGTIVASADSVRPAATSPATRVFQFDDGTVNNNIRSGSTATLQVVDAGVTQVNITATPAITFDGTVFKFASAYKLNDFASVTTGAVATDTSGTIPTVTQLSLGGPSTSGVLNGHIRSITYYPYRLADFQLQALTA